jgi:radical SAM superfamily enzyme with C-terminal helix-hairpin-helix motif
MRKMFRLGLGLATKNGNEIAGQAVEYLFSNNRACYNLLATKSFNRLASKGFSKAPTLITRSFHTTQSYRGAGDLGSSGSRHESRELAKKFTKRTCQICKVNPPTHQTCIVEHVSHRYCDIAVTPYCDVCWEKRRNLESDRESQWEQMLKHVRGLEGKKRVPIAYAVDKLRSSKET